MNRYFMAIWLWALAWLALDIALVLVFNGLRGRGTALSAAGAALTLFTAAVLANAGTGLW